MFIGSHGVEAALCVNKPTTEQWESFSEPLSDDAFICRTYRAIHRIRGAEVVAAMQTYLHALAVGSSQRKAIEQRLAFLHFPNIDGHPIPAEEIDTADGLEPKDHLPGDTERQVKFAQDLRRPWPDSDDQVICGVCLACSADQDASAWERMPFHNRFVKVK